MKDTLQARKANRCVVEYRNNKEMLRKARVLQFQRSQILFVQEANANTLKTSTPYHHFCTVLPYCNFTIQLYVW